MIKVLIIVMALMILVAFMYQILVIYNIANNVNTTVERTVISLASYNKPVVYSSMREGNTMVVDESALFGREELMESLCNELSATQLSESSLMRESNEGGFFYRITNLDVEIENIASRSSDFTVTFITGFDLEIPVAAFWNFGSINIPMQVRSTYTSKG